MEGAGEGPSSSPSTRLTRCPSSASRAMVAERVEREAGQGWYFPCQGGGPSAGPPAPLAAPSPSGGTLHLCLRWAVRVPRLHQMFTSSQQPAAGEGRRWVHGTRPSPQTGRSASLLPTGSGMYPTPSPQTSEQLLPPPCSPRPHPAPAPSPKARCPPPPRAAGPLASEEMGQLEHTLPSSATAAVWPGGACLPRPGPSLGGAFPQATPPRLIPWAPPSPHCLLVLPPPQGRGNVPPPICQHRGPPVTYLQTSP